METATQHDATGLLIWQVVITAVFFGLGLLLFYYFKRMKQKNKEQNDKPR